MKELSGQPSIFLSSDALLPPPHSQQDAQRGLQQWLEAVARHPSGEWMQEAAENACKPLLLSVFGNSPYLTRLLLQFPDLLHSLVTIGSEETKSRLFASLDTLNEGHEVTPLMQALRIAKGRLALLTALCDITQAWTLEQVTEALSTFAERSLSLSLDTLLRSAHQRGEINLPDMIAPSVVSGIIVLGMGKLGGRELNYSSDIDLILFFEKSRIPYKGRQTEQHFMNKLAHELVNVMQERTRDGYVFRTDLRLRPDPASTPPAITTDAALYYYESVGQNWERAAMIKARPVAGDMAAAERFLKRVSPFMWRRNLDFAAINDIHSIKRQMDSGQSKEIKLAGHNVKLGMGGIREIEFYTQIHQLIWGGRQPALRTRGTVETLSKLAEIGLIDSSQELMLRDNYATLRKLEHRLQMIADEQTHDIPTTAEGIAHVAHFMGYDDINAFEKEMLTCMDEVHTLYASSFKSAENLGEEQGNLVFTGSMHDPDTIRTLRQMGFGNPETISEIVMGWHHGSRRATRTKRARELLTELMPVLLKRLSETANPDAAFLKFNDFLSNLPAGVQLFSLFSQNPHLLGLIADIMGSAPTLADTLSKSPALLDAVLTPDFYGPLPTTAQMEQQLSEVLAELENFDDVMDELRRFRNEKQFQAGVQLLKRMINARQAGIFLSSLADLVIGRTLNAVTADFARSYGTIKKSRFAVIALGKLGSREMTFSSDIDLVFVYDVPDFDMVSDGEKGFSASVYYTRLSQRFLNALSGMGREGRLYEVDTRLRPSGAQGLLAVSKKALRHYFDELAWTFEFMAFTKARVACGDESFRDTLEAFICEQLARPRDLQKLQTDVLDMRARIEKEHGTTNPWDIKQVRGGLMDIDFIAQYLLLRHAPNTPGVKPGNAVEIFDWLKRTNRLDGKIADSLTEADRFLGQIFNMLRLCTDRNFDETSAGLKKLLVETSGEKDFASLKDGLVRVEESVFAHYKELLKTL